MGNVAPSRGRGLKPVQRAAGRVKDGVAPSRGRGLKPGDEQNGHGYGRSPLHGGVD